MKTKFLIYIILFNFLTLHLHSAFDNSSYGTTSASILRLDINPKCAAMGGACASAIYDSSAIDINPAGLIKVKKTSFYFSYNKFFEDIYCGHISYAKNLSKNTGVFGLGVKYLKWGDIDKTDDYANNIGTINPNELVFEIGFAGYLGGMTKDPEDRIVFGGIGKFIRQEIDSSATTLSADIGLFFPYLFDRRLLISMVFQNIIGSIKMDKENYNITKIIKIGSSIFLGKNLTITSDIILPEDRFLYWAIGIETSISINKRTNIFFRGGANTSNISDLEGLRGISFGFGLKHWEYSLDYSFSPFGDLGNVHRISLSLNY
ncbi:MAG: PorV/PorQ family protein [Elusimicrobiota bacterium]